MTEPLAVIALNHAKLELWPDCVRTVFADGKEVVAAPNGDETILDCAIHECLHSIYAQVTHDRPSACLRAVADGEGKRWTPERKAEEAFCYGAGLILTDAMRKMAKAYD